MKDQAALNNDARKNTTLQWNTNPCGAISGIEENSLAYFLGVEKNRYQIQSWMHNYFHFEKFSGKRVLEIGVGQGTDLVQFANAGALCHGIDITDRHLALAKQNMATRGLTAEFKKCDAISICYPDGYFDAVYSFGVIHHIPEANQVFSEIQRVLKPGGTVHLGLYYKYSGFHLAQLLYNGIIHGKLFTLGYSGVLAIIERGADGKTIKPYVKLYTKRNLRKLLSNFNFKIEDISVHQLEPPILRALPFAKIFHLEKLLGWYLSCTATKRA